jgi:hypothetical protein
MSRSRPRAAIRAMPAAPTHRKPKPETLLEGSAAEFALLAQRRARLRRQLDLLERQRAAADGVMAQVEARMAVLSQRMAGFGAGLAAPAPAVPPPAPAPAPAPRRRGALMHYGSPEFPR